MLGEYSNEVAALLLRLFLGVLFLFQGYDKVFRVGIRGVIDAFETPMRDHAIGRPLLVAGAALTSYIELIGGGMLILGFYKYIALYALGIDLLLVATALTIVQPIWDMQHVFRRFILLIFLMLIPDIWDIWSLDHFLK